MFEGFEALEVDVNGLVIAGLRKGHGDPVLLLHGFPQTKEMWARVAPILAANYTIICADLRGYGDSGKPLAQEDYANYSFRQMALDNVGLMRSLGYEQFHVIGHDRGGRVGHRMALDYPDKVLSLALLDVVPTHSMFMEVNRNVARAYWHWYFLSQPTPFPEEIILSDPDRFFESCLVGWGATGIEAFAPEILAKYRAAWRKPDAVYGACADYRAAALVDIEIDRADFGTKVDCPVLVYYGENGSMAECFDIPIEWEKFLSNMSSATTQGGHFFVDEFPNEVARELGQHLASVEKLR